MLITLITISLLVSIWLFYLVMVKDEQERKNHLKMIDKDILRRMNKGELNK